MENWKQVFDLNYEVSDLGNVRSLHSRNFHKIIAKWADHEGYEHVSLQINKKAKRFAVHQLVLKTFIGDKPSEIHQAAHLNSIRNDNRLTNLCWKTPLENQLDRIQNGTAKPLSERPYHPYRPNTWANKKKPIEAVAQGQRTW